MKKLHIVYFNAGGGHRTTALALAEQLSIQNPFIQISLVDIQCPSLLGSLDVLRRLTGFSGVDLYNLMLRKDWTVFGGLYLALSRVNINLLHESGVKLLVKYWQETRPDAVVSLIPLFNRVLIESLTRALPHARFLTVMTDLADSPPDYWFQFSNQSLVCPTPRAVQQGLDNGHSASHLHQTSGLVLSPTFYKPRIKDREGERLSLGLDPKVPTGLVMFGANGANTFIRIAQVLNTISSRIQLIYLCGGVDERIRAQLQAITRHPSVQLGYTNEVPYYMSLSDFFIGKPGNICVSEAIHMGLPVITQSSLSTLAQEKYTCVWIESNRFGIVINSWNQVAVAVEEMTDSFNLHSYQQRVAKVENNGLFETSTIIERLLCS